MKFIIALFVLISSFAFAQSPGPGMMCSFENGYFRVYDGMNKYEKYVGGSQGSAQCGRQISALVTDSRFVTYSNGTFQDKYVGGNGARIFRVRGRMAVAVMGPYLLVAKAGGSILQEYLTTSAAPSFDISGTNVILSIGQYIYASDGNEIVEKYVTSNQNPILSAGREVSGALVGSYFVIYNNGTIVDKYVGNRGGNDSLAGGKAKVIAASVGNYFVVYDAFRSQFQDEYVGQGGRVEVRDDGAYHVSQSGKITRYNLMSGDFDR
jgi:hypothetical protein